MLTSTMRIRVEWSNCDPAGIIFNPHYYIWMDAGSHALMKAAGIDMATEVKADETFMGYPLVTSTAQFHTPAMLGDVLTLTTTVEKFGNTSFETRHTFHRTNHRTSHRTTHRTSHQTSDTTENSPTDTLLCSGSEVRVWGGSDENNNLIALRVPDWVRQNLSVDKTIDSSV